MKITESPAVFLIFGGRGAEHSVSVEGARFVFPLIDTAVRKFPIYIRRDGRWLIQIPRQDSCCIGSMLDGSVPTEECAPAYFGGVGGIATKDAFIPAISAFPLLHGDFGEDGVVQGALENARIPFVGCGVSAAAVARDKAFVKLLASSLGIPTARWVSVEGDAEEGIGRADSTLDYPMFVKPARLGSSIGAGIAKDRKALCKLLENALTLGGGRCVVEEYVSCECELEIGYFSTKSKELFTNIGEIRTIDGFYSYEKKYECGGASVSSVSAIPKASVEKIRSFSKMLVRSLGIASLCRVDFFLTKTGEILFNEINTMPGFTSGSLYPRLLSETGISPQDAINLLIFDRPTP